MRCTYGMGKQVMTVSLFLVALAGWSPSAHAVLLDFDTLSDDQGNSSVQTYIRNILHAVNPAWSVTVSGAKAETEYTGDGHVVGPVVNSHATSETLGTSNGGVHHSGLDTFLMNSGSDRITMLFNFPIYQVSFDYEIFPDATTPDGRNSSPANANWPDFTLLADGTTVFNTNGVMPSGATSHSPSSGVSHTEYTPQFLGQSGTWNFAHGVTKLEFVDWPVAIGIDNLDINHSPEPGSMVLLSLGLVSMGLRRRFSSRRTRG